MSLTRILLSSSMLFAALAPSMPALAQEPLGVEVAQQRLGMFHDRRGWRIYYDLDTDEIVAMEPPADERRFDAPAGARVREEDVYRPDYGDDDRGIVRRQPVERQRLPDPEPQIVAPKPVAPRSDAPAVAAPRRDRQPAVETDDTQIATGSIAVDRPSTPKDGLRVTAIQVALDRMGFSPGAIDGVMGSNVRKALAAYREARGHDLDQDDRAIYEALQQTGGPALTDYTITESDVAGPFIESVPEDYALKAQLPAMSFTSPRELLAERFHMDESYLAKLNPGVDFRRPGTTIRVASTGSPAKGEVTRIIADKGAKQVRAYGADGRLLVAYPATIGSASTPSPTGTVAVERIALDPNYTYNPKINFVQGNNTSILTIPPGPNGPVGAVWIALSKPTYGIHGTPEPSRIGKTYSNGCVRLTNWDARELAKMVRKGVTVEFVE